MSEAMWTNIANRHAGFGLSRHAGRAVAVMTVLALVALAVPAAVAQEESGPGTTIASGLKRTGGMPSGRDRNRDVTEGAGGGETACL